MISTPLRTCWKITIQKTSLTVSRMTKATSSASSTPPSGMFYTQVIDSDLAAKDEDPAKERTICKPTVKIGWLAKNGGRAESTKFWSPETFEKVSIIGISTALGYVFGNMVTKALTGRVTGAAAAAADEAATAYAAKKVWNVDAWHHDNGIVAGGGGFATETMPAVTGELGLLLWQTLTRGHMMMGLHSRRRQISLGSASQGVAGSFGRDLRIPEQYFLPPSSSG
ncbi:hypothetical protein B0T18DRAFT_82567 [Schizothecium vesticola]|uniref:Uncharacterized protein n=1 Tax=Schizothecium vesticola TaxID=314040 RepID=A0AA40F6F0_9PEZI|nr:hypothetical protein B0T18DRAFT_82567 [Schizothecium vesticola]